MSYYEDKFYKERQEESKRSAREVIPIVLDLMKPDSVIDVGCGVGTWLSVFRELGVNEIFGVDGPWVDKRMLQIPEDAFIPFDLTKPLQINRRFDLVVSLEVAEHLPEESAESFVNSLTELGPVILFSAAIPFQVGKHHMNEQWQIYWSDLFENRGYIAIDAVRKKIWQNDNVEYYYAQNILIFCRKDRLDEYPTLKIELDNTNFSQLSLVHPKMYLFNCTPIKLIMATPIINEIFLNIVTNSFIRAKIRDKFLGKRAHGRKY